ncbi:MAG: hypothetical protein QOG64_1460 [Acidimicrobiaceae bacterium]|jgi:hypothetical protein|nr:hypothetical protein [Acidimicrobiaceae bacterium]
MRFAKNLFNQVWTYLEQADRTADDDAAMIHAAHASRHHWSKVGGPEQAARGEWQCSRVYATVGRAEAAMYHARRCLDVCQRHGIGAFDLAFAHEAIARAHAIAGNATDAAQHLGLARTAAAGIADDDDRELVLADLASIEPG